MAKTPKKPSSVTQEEWDLLTDLGLLAAMSSPASSPTNSGLDPTLLESALKEAATAYEEALFGVPKKEFVDPTDLGLLAAMSSPASSPTNSGLTRLEKKTLSKKARLVRQTEDLAARGRERTLIKHAIDSANNKEMDPVLAKMMDAEVRAAKTAGTVGSLGSLTAAEAAARLKEIIKLEAEGLEPHFAQSGQNVLDSERQLLNASTARARNTPGTGLFNEEVQAQVKGRAAAKYAVRQAATRGTLEPEAARLLDATVRGSKPGLSSVAGGLSEAEAAAQFAKTGPLGRAAGAAGVAADVAGGTISAGALAAMTNKGGTISKSALTSLAKATGKSVGFLTKAAGVLGWVGLAYTLYENTIGRRNEARTEEATGLLESGLRGMDNAGTIADEAYARMLPGVAGESERAASAGRVTDFNNSIALDGLVRENANTLRQTAQVTPMSIDEYMLRVKAAVAARGG